MSEWVRITAPIDSEEDRRTIVAILASAGLEVRIIKERKNSSRSAPYVRYVEFK